MINMNYSGRGVTAVLGPTNTGKTHLAIERMTAYPSGVIGLPLRLLAREVYHRVADRVGIPNVALVTGEEKISPPNARYQVCTVEAMPSSTDAEFVAIDEVQLATDFERGHVFTDRLLNLRGAHETMLLGAGTVSKPLQELLPGINLVTRPRMSVLTYSGSKKITRLPRRSAIVAFSSEEVYAIAELIRRQRGGAAVVMGSLSPRTRNAQVALYQSGDVDFIVATDAVGMGLNLDVDHVAFAQDQKFDGHQYRRLTAAELAQVAGRAGRHTRDGTFGVTSQVGPFADELVEALETHAFAPVKVFNWRNRNLDYSSVNSLRGSLDLPSGNQVLTKSPQTSDSRALDYLVKDPAVADRCNDAYNTRLLWEICCVPDYRRTSPNAHGEILKSIFLDIVDYGHLDEEWFGTQVAHCDRTDGEIDALSARIAHTRTWTYISNRSGWLENSEFWQEKTREVENRLSDALHESLTKRFVDRRTSVLMKRLRENAMLEAEISDDGNVSVEGHHVGYLHGFRFVADKAAEGSEAKAANAAATKALASEIEKRAEKLMASPNSDFSIASDGTIRWVGAAVAKATAGENALEPRILLLADEQLTGGALERVRSRISRWLGNHINTLLKPLMDLKTDTTLQGVAKGIAYRLHEELGILKRQDVMAEVKSLDQDMRASLRKHGVRFGAYHIFLPLMLKPAPTSLICLLWSLRHEKLDAPGLEEIPQASAAGRTSLPVNQDFESAIYPLCGFRILGNKAVRIDILERLADLIRPTTMWKPEGGQPKPEGAIDGRNFYVTPAMMSILGATHEDMEEILKGLGYKAESRLRDEIIPPEVTVPEAPEGGEQKAEGGEISKADVASDGQNVDEKAVDDNTNKTFTEPVVDTIDNESTDGDKIAPEDADLEQPKTILIWRYQRSEKPANNQRFKKKKFHKNTPQDSRPRSGGKNASGNKFQKKKPEKVADPDSPFAKLAALKETLKK